MRRKLTASRSLRSAFSIVEVAVSTLLVGVVLVGAMNLLGGVVRGRGNIADRDRATLLAEELLSEVLENNYEDEDKEFGVFGPESWEVSGTRELFDDVDDFHSWNKTPPEYRNGDPMPNLANWRRKITVDNVDPNDSTTTASIDQGVKRITIEVYNNSTLAATKIAIRTDGWGAIE